MTSPPAPPSSPNRRRRIILTVAGLVLALAAVGIAYGISSGGTHPLKATSTSATREASHVTTTTMSVGTRTPASRTTTSPPVTQVPQTSALSPTTTQPPPTTTIAPPSTTTTTLTTTLALAKTVDLWWAPINVEYGSLVAALSTLTEGGAPQAATALGHVEQLQAGPAAPDTAINTPWQAALTDFHQALVECQSGFTSSNATEVNACAAGLKNGEAQIAVANAAMGPLTGQGIE